MEMYLTILIWLNKETIQICRQDAQACYTLCSSLNKQDPELGSYIKACSEVSGSSPTIEAEEVLNLVAVILELLSGIPEDERHPTLRQLQRYASVKAHNWPQDNPALATDPDVFSEENSKNYPGPDLEQPIAISKQWPSNESALKAKTIPNNSRLTLPAKLAVLASVIGKPKLTDLELPISDHSRQAISLGSGLDDLPRPTRQPTTGRKAIAFDLKQYLMSVNGINKPSENIFAKVSRKMQEKCRMKGLIGC